jgi:hypothetical protein
VTGGRRAGPGPANHRVTRDEPGGVLGGLVLPWSPDPDASGAWTCLCGQSGDGQPSATAHLRDEATAAFARVDNHRAVALVQVSDATAPARAAMAVIAGNSHWHANPLIRQYMHPYYDWWGCLAVAVDWPALAAADLPGDPTDQLVLQVAASIAGVSVPLILDNLLTLPEHDARNVRSALVRLLPVEDH